MNPTPDDIIRYKLRYTMDSRQILNLLLLGTIILIVLLVLFIIVQFGTRVTPLYFQLNSNAQITVPVPLDKEGISKPALLNWVNEALNASFSFNYSNQNRQPSILAAYFSENALKIYIDLLTNDEDFNIISSKQYVVSVQPTAAPEILTGKPYKGRYVWQIRIPARIRFSNALSNSYQDVVMEYLVWRVPETESALGIIVASFSRKVTGRVAPRGINRGF